jgi:hypothetical protein
MPIILNAQVWSAIGALALAVVVALRHHSQSKT